MDSTPATTTVQGVAYKPTMAFGIPLADPKMAGRVKATLLLSLLPLLGVIAFSITLWFVTIPLYVWFYVIFIVTALAPTSLFYSLQYNKSSFMALYAFLNALLAGAQTLNVWQILSYVSNCETFVSECKVNGLLVVNAVSNPKYTCSYYTVVDYMNFQYWADTADRTTAYYMSFFTPIVVAHLVLIVLALMFYVKLRKGGAIAQTCCPPGVAGSVVGAASIARGTEASDSSKVAVGVPVDTAADRV